MWRLALVALLSAAAMPLLASDDQPYWEPSAYDWSARLGLVQRGQNIGISLPGNGRELLYEPNTKGNLDAEIQYKGYALSATLAHAEAENSADYGHTRLRDFQLRSYQNRWGYEVLWQKYQGFYYEDNSGSLYYRDDISSRRLSVTALYTFSPDRFHMAAAYGQNYRQLRSGFSWLAYASLGSYRLSSRDGLVKAPMTTLYPEFSPLQDYQNLNMLSSGVGAGFGYSWVWRAFFINIININGVSLQQQTIDWEYGEEKRRSINAESIAKLSAGLNRQRHMAGLEIHYTSTQAGDSDYYRIDLSSFESRLFYGYRF